MAVGSVKFSTGNYCNVGQHFQWAKTQPHTIASDEKQARLPADNSNLPVVCTHANAGPKFPCPFENFAQAVTGYASYRQIADFEGLDYLGVYVAVNICDNNPHRVVWENAATGSWTGIRCWIDTVERTVLKEAGSATTLSGATTTTNDLIIGNQLTLSTLYWDILGMFRLYDAAVGASLVQYGSYSSAPPPPNLAHCVLAYDFGEGAGTTVTDLSSSGFNGTLSASNLWNAYRFQTVGAGEYQQQRRMGLQLGMGL